MTTLETGIRASRRSRHRSLVARAGFTLLEILLVFALIALAAGVILANFTTFLNFDDRIDPGETLRAAIRSARFQAAGGREVTRLRFDKESGALLIEPGERFPLHPDFGKDGRGEIRFYLVPPAEGMGRFPDAARTQLETKEVRFAPDRSSSPFVAEIDRGQGNPERLVFDPFSSLVRSPE